MSPFDTLLFWTILVAAFGVGFLLGFLSGATL